MKQSLLRGFQKLFLSTTETPGCVPLITGPQNMSRQRKYAQGRPMLHKGQRRNNNPALKNQRTPQNPSSELQADRIISTVQHMGLGTATEVPLTSRPRARFSQSRRRPTGQTNSANNNIGAQGKRKATRAADGAPPTQRQRLRKTEPFVNEAYIRNNFKVPSLEDYPAAPPELFKIDGMVLTLHNLIKQEWEMRKEIISRGPPANDFQCMVQCHIPNFGEITAMAHGRNKREAIRNSTLMFLVKLHECGVLEEAFSHEQLDEGTMGMEYDAKVDVYNYAARFGLVPKVSFRMVKSPLRARKKPSVEMTIELRDQNIKVMSRGINMETAEMSASIKFKQQAEKYYAEHSDEIMVIKDSTALNTSNMKNFVDFYKLKKGKANFTIKASAERTLTNQSCAHRCQVLLNDVSIGQAVTMTGKRKTVEGVAYLTAAIELTRNDPEFLLEFKKAVSASSGGILLPLRPQTAIIDGDAALIMEDTLRELRKEGLQDEKETISSSEDEGRHPLRIPPQPSLAQINARNVYLRQRMDRYQKDPKLKYLRKKREELPMTQYRTKVLDHVEKNQYSVIVGATGSGKTTQVPQILLEHAVMDGRGGTCNIICTQPRRIAATSIARRVAEERGEKLQDSVGYHVRFDAKLPSITGSILYCTTGILLQQLQHRPDDLLDRVSHLIVDEVHERDILIDFLLIILKRTIAERLKAGRSVPRIILMSATIDSKLFTDYFLNSVENGERSICPSLSVPGRTFPVTEKYLEEIIDEIDEAYPKEKLSILQTDLATKDYLNIENQFSKIGMTLSNSEEADSEGAIDWRREITSTDGSVFVSNEKEDAIVPVGLVLITLGHIARCSTEGAVLVFLPGLDEIKKVEELLHLERIFGVDFNDEKKYRLCVLHSTVPAADQAAVFEPVPPGCRKIILSTNIAETSVTIPDVQYVVDTGKLREKRYDQTRRITKLQCTWISKSNAKQRAGRAGRVQNGHYFALYSKARFKSLRAIGLPEMLRSDLQEICLDIKAQKFKVPIREFLADAIEPPSANAVDVSVENLISLEALTKQEDLTALGHLLASLPVHPSLGKMIVLGVIFRCLDPMIILGSIINQRSLFVAPITDRELSKSAHREYLEGTESDHLALINAFRHLRATQDQYGEKAMASLAFKSFLHLGAFRTLASTSLSIKDILIDAGLIPSAQHRIESGLEIGGAAMNQNSDNLTLVKALALAGLHPNLAVNTTSMTYRTPGEKNTMIHPSSLNYAKRRADGRVAGPSLISYSTMFKSNDNRSIYLRDVTNSSPLMAILFGGYLEAKGNLIAMDDWLPFYIKGAVGMPKLIIEFRKAMDRVLTAAFGNLASLRGKSDGKYLADERVIEILASGVTEVLKRDTRNPGTDFSFRRPLKHPREVTRNGKDLGTTSDMLGILSKHVGDSSIYRAGQSHSSERQISLTAEILEALERDLIQGTSRRSK